MSIPLPDRPNGRIKVKRASGLGLADHCAQQAARIPGRRTWVKTVPINDGQANAGYQASQNPHGAFPDRRMDPQPVCNPVTLDSFRNERDICARRLETAQVAVERAQHDAPCAVHVPLNDDGAIRDRLRAARLLRDKAVP